MKTTIHKAMSSLTAKLAALLFAFTCAGTAWGATTQVATQADLTSAVATAAAGDTVQITAAGTYTLGNIPQAITIEGAVSGVTLDYSGVAETVSFGTAASGTLFKSIGSSRPQLSVDAEKLASTSSIVVSCCFMTVAS